MRPQDGAGREKFGLSPCPTEPWRGHGGCFGTAGDEEQPRPSLNLPAFFPFPAGKATRAWQNRGKSPSPGKKHQFRWKCLLLASSRRGPGASPALLPSAARPARGRWDRAPASSEGNPDHWFSQLGDVPFTQQTLKPALSPFQKGGV